MNKLDILWIDDKWQELDSFKDVCELPQNGLNIIPFTNSVDGMEYFKTHIETLSGVILDAKVYKDRHSEVDNLSGLTNSIKCISELSYQKRVPYYIFTGQPDTASGSSFAEEHEGHYYEKDRDEDRLLKDIKKNALDLEDNQIRYKYPEVFNYWSEIDHDLIRILKAQENEDWKNNSILNDVRKILSNILTRCYDRGLCSIKHDGSNLAECSRMLGQRCMEELIPVYIQRAIHFCVDVTNPGSHRTQTDSDVAEGKAPYLIRSLIGEMLSILYWLKDLPQSPEAIEQMKMDVGRLVQDKKEIQKAEEYEGKDLIVEQDGKNYFHCGQCLLSFNAAQNHLGKKVTLYGIKENNTNSKDVYPFFATKFRVKE